MSLKSLRAQASREALRVKLGARCARCAEQRDLQFDCISPRGAAHHHMAWPQRMRWYWSEHLAGNLQLLCGHCHRLKTSRDNSKGMKFLYVVGWPDF